MHPFRWYRRLEVSPRRLRQWAFQSVFWFFLVVSTGALVRLTASGLGCDHWPNCDGNVGIPTKGGHSLIEGGNRLIAVVAIVLSLVTWLAAIRTPGLRGRVRWAAFLVFLGAVAEIPLGKITIDTGLNPWVVMSHFFLAVAVVTLAAVVLVAARSLEVGVAPWAPPRRIAVLGTLVPLLGIAVLVSGAITTGSGPHPGASGAKTVKRLPYFWDAVHVHAYLTATLALVVIGFVLALWHLTGRLVAGRGGSAWAAMPGVLGDSLRRRRPAGTGPDAATAQRLTEHAVVVALLLAAQMVVGWIQYHESLPWWLVLVHVTLFGAFWVWSVVLATALWRPPRAAVASPARVAQPAAPGVD